MAITLGMKAARHKCVLILDASSSLAGNQWLRSMASPFAAGREVVLGHAVICTDGNKSLPSRYRVDYSLDVISWLTAALSRHPYRGTAYNIGYTTDLFFRKKGFAASLNLSAGDDDIFINSIATPANTAVVLGEQARVTVKTSNPEAHYRRQRVSHIFTGERLPKSARRSTAAISIILWLSLILSIVTTYLTLPQWWPSAMAWIMTFTQWTIVSLTLSKVMDSLGVSINRFSIVPALLWRPFLMIHLKLLSRRNRHLNYAWANDSRFATKTLGKHVL